MTQLALVTPWPPQPSGIADYAFDLAIGLSQRGARVTVFTDERNPVPPGHEVCVLPIAQFPGSARFDHVVYQMGNHPRFHSAMIPLLAQHGGIVHLHDIVLQHLIAFYTCGQGNKRLYQQLLLHWYGQATLDEFLAWNNPNHRLFWDSDHVTDIPLFEPVLRFGQACIVHSQFAEQRVRQRFPGLPCQVIPQAYRNTHVVPSSEHPRFRIGVFGNVQPHKHIDKVLRAVAHSVAQGANIELAVVGALDGPCKTLPQLAEELGLGQRIAWYGRAEEATFLQLMRSVDLCLALRYPTMGETSAVVSRALQMGIPTIVSNVGWYAELPAVVQKLSVDRRQMQSELDDLIARHALDPAFHRQARGAASLYARASFDFAKICVRYLQTLEQLSRAMTPAQHCA